MIVCWDHEGESFLAALDKRTGATRWRVARDEKTAWATPLIVEHEGRTQVVTSATRKVRGYDAGTGALIWECAGLTDNVVASPVYSKGILVAGNSYYRGDVRGAPCGSDRDITRTDRVLAAQPADALRVLAVTLQTTTPSIS